MHIVRSKLTKGLWPIESTVWVKKTTTLLPEGSITARKKERNRKSIQK